MKLLPSRQSLSSSKRLRLMKVEAYLDYGFSVIGINFNGMLMAKMGLPVVDFFLLSVISVITAFVGNRISRRSDIHGDRFTYIFLSAILGIIATFFIAFYQNFFIIIAGTVLNSIISGESSANVIVYELIDQKQRALDPSSTAFKKFNKSREFAKYRVFGSIRFAWTAPFGGYGIQVLNSTGGMPYFGYTVMYCISGIGGIGVCLFLWFTL